MKRSREEEEEEEEEEDGRTEDAARKTKAPQHNVGKKQPSPESFHVIVSTPCTPTSMLSGQVRYQRSSEKTAIQVGTCQETNQQH